MTDVFGSKTFEDLAKRIATWMQARFNHYVSLDESTYLTSTSWDGDSFGPAVAKTKIDLSAVFGVPANVKAVDVEVWVRDSGSAGVSSFIGIILSPGDTASVGKTCQCNGVTNDAIVRHHLKVPCNSDGDIYYQITASGASTLDIWIQIWGYWL